MKSANYLKGKNATRESNAKAQNRTTHQPILEADKSKKITNKNKTKMEKQFIKELAEQIVAAALNTETLPIKSWLDYSWQDFSMVSDADAEELENEGRIRVTGTIYDSGSVSLNINVSSTAANQDALRDAYKRLKAKNLVLVSIERAGDAKRADDESTELLEKAADMLGITPAQALEMVNKSEEKQ